MKRWEIVKGMQEGTFKVGDTFEVYYPNCVGEQYYYASINESECLVWDNNTLVHFTCFSEDVWTKLA
ncbi:hypothetical protein [Priestia aryabhattai]|uniref:hypothetical protein n=1 Tax=Priestia aryabhattai TaxID=412384 RepID=UPI0015F3E158|nr:hypothetical protein [Priestia aryabhattai]